MEERPLPANSTSADSARVRFARAAARRDPILRLYAVLDAESCTRRKLDLIQTAQALVAGGVRLLQYRDKPADESTYLRNARILRNLLPDNAFFLLNDYAHLVQAAGADGVHIGQDDCTAAAARERIGPEAILGISTHSADQAHAADSLDVDYVAIGPVFSTTTKVDADPVVGLCGVQAASALVNKPLVAIGGIGLGDARAVEMAGADSVAVISALVPSSDPEAVTRTAQDFLARLK